MYMHIMILFGENDPTTQTIKLLLSLTEHMKYSKRRPNCMLSNNKIWHSKWMFERYVHWRGRLGYVIEWCVESHANHSICMCHGWLYLHRRNTLNTLRPRQNGRHFADDVFKCIFLNENIWISIRMSLKFVPKGPVNNIPSLVQIMAWRRPGDKS